MSKKTRFLFDTNHFQMFKRYNLSNKSTALVCLHSQRIRCCFLNLELLAKFSPHSSQFFFTGTNFFIINQRKISDVFITLIIAECHFAGTNSFMRDQVGLSDESLLPLRLSPGSQFWCSLENVAVTVWAEYFPDRYCFNFTKSRWGHSW